MLFCRMENDTMDETIVDYCGKWIILGDTISKGKNSDCVFHNAYLAYIIKMEMLHEITWECQRFSTTLYIPIAAKHNINVSKISGISQLQRIL